MEKLTDYLNSNKNKFLDEDKTQFCNCGNILKTDRELDLKVCRECY